MESGDLAPGGKYHHGSLPKALRQATAELVAERGPTGFSLREVARRAGVSHAAPAHHFGDSSGLLTAVAVEGFEKLKAAFEATMVIADPIERLNALGKAYVHVAMEYPGHFGVMCAEELVNSDNPAYVAVSISAYELLLETIRDLAAAINPRLDVEAAATLAWSAVHGLSVLSSDLPDVADKTNTKYPGLDALIDQFTVLLVEGFRGAERLDSV